MAGASIVQTKTHHQATIAIYFVGMQPRGLNLGTPEWSTIRRWTYRKKRPFWDRI